MRKYKLEITGKTPLLLHPDNIEWADKMKLWRQDPMNKKKSVAGDDRTPAFSWLGNLAHDNEHLAIPVDYLMSCMMAGGAMVPTGKGTKTFKAQTQSGSLVDDPYIPLQVRGQLVPIAPFLALDEEEDFRKHKEEAEKHGFFLFVKRVKIGNAKHVRVRPRFDSWALSTSISVWDGQLDTVVLKQIWTCAGQYKGLGDWRPGARTPGSYGMFNVELTELS